MQSPELPLPPLGTRTSPPLPPFLLRQARISDLEAALAAAEARIATLQGALSDADAELEGAYGQLSEAQAQIYALRDQVRHGSAGKGTA